MRHENKTVWSQRVLRVAAGWKHHSLRWELGQEEQIWGSYQHLIFEIFSLTYSLGMPSTVLYIQVQKLEERSCLGIYTYTHICAHTKKAVNPDPHCNDSSKHHFQISLGPAPNSTSQPWSEKQRTYKSLLFISECSPGLELGLACMSGLNSIRVLLEGEGGFDLRVQGLFPHSGPCPLVPISSDHSLASPASPWLELANSTAESQHIPFPPSTLIPKSWSSQK